MAKTRLKTIKVNNQSVRFLEECYKEYLEYCKSIGQRPATLESKEKFYRYELLKRVKADDKISVINKKTVEGWINKLIDDGYKGGTYQTFVIKLKAFLTYCFTREYLEEFAVKIPNILLEKKEIYTELELKKLLKRPDLNTCVAGDYRSYVTIQFLIATGCRSTTLLNVKVKDLDFKKNSILFRHMKTYRQVTSPMSKTLKIELQEYIHIFNLQANDILFPKLDGTQMSYDTLHQNLVNYFRHCKVKMRGVNTFRNTFATMFIKNGGDIYRLKLLLNHSNIKTTERYVNLLPLDIKEDLLQYNPLDALQTGNKRSRIRLRKN
ncbi:site-specific integrase [Clostridium botulinum]|uniref:tyrosine-type recombinase/integrase n=1 Tax=Clostridium botulinum TaxID=1491 RepID=UPI0013FF0107|nr:site-specific integrase [Clostridium botulinum]MBY6915367.1 site-specific integrase [Clostridium botulinum]NFQ37733.1 site-specific integrase [Clostridium botulinum]